MRKRRPLLLLAVAVAIALLVPAGVFVRSHWFGPWPRLRDEVSRLSVPDAFRLVDRKEEGSESCFISCDEPRITLIFVTDLDDGEACRWLESQVREIAEDVHPWDPHRLIPAPGAACHWQGKLPEAGDDATLSASIEPGASLLSSPYRSGYRGQPPAVMPTDRVAYFLFNSGID